MAVQIGTSSPHILRFILATVCTVIEPECVLSGLYILVYAISVRIVFRFFDPGNYGLMVFFCDATDNRNPSWVADLLKERWAFSLLQILSIR